MNQKTKTILSIVGIGLLVVGIGTGIGIFATRARNKRNAEEIEVLLQIAHKEGNLTQEGYTKLRKLVYLDEYKLPANLQNAFNKIQPLLVKAGNGIRTGFPVSSMQFFTDIRSIVNTESNAVKTQYSAVEHLLQEAFKLNATSDSVQQKINSANEKSAAWWRVVVEVITPTPALIASGGKSEVVALVNKWTKGNVTPEARNFDRNLMNQSWETLKLFSESYKALSGGKDFFAIPKNP